MSHHDFAVMFHGFGPELEFKTYSLTLDDGVML